LSVRISRLDFRLTDQDSPQQDLLNHFRLFSGSAMLVE